MENTSLEVIADTADLYISFERGVSRTAVVSFTGVGGEIGGIQKEEFAGSLRNQAVMHSMFFVIDRRRSWFNRTHDEILDHLAPRLEGYDQVITLGNSMGGFGALYFSGLFPRCNRAISFVPQYSVAPDTPERRWRKYRSEISEWNVRHALENMSSNCPAVVVFGSGEGADRWHVTQFREHLREPHAVIVVPSGGHAVALSLRGRGVLYHFIAAAIEGVSAPVLRDLLLSAGLPTS